MKQKLKRSIIIILCCVFSVNAGALCSDLWDPILESSSLAGLIFFSLTSKECKDGGSSFDCLKGGFAPALGLALGLGAVNAVRSYAGGCYHLDSLKNEADKINYDTIWRTGSNCDQNFEFIGFPDKDEKGIEIKAAVSQAFENEKRETNGSGCFIISFIDEQTELESNRIKEMKICATRQSDNFRRCCEFKDDNFMHGNYDIKKASHYLVKSIIYGKNAKSLGGKISINGEQY